MFSKYPDAPIKPKNTEFLKNMRKFFPYMDDDPTGSRKSITIRSKVLPGLELNENKRQKFNFRDIILNIKKKGFTINDSIESVNDTLRRLKILSLKKSPFDDISYDDYIKQVEDEVLAHIVEGDEFKNIGKLGEYLFLGDEDEMLDDNAYEKDEIIRNEKKEVNDLIKCEIKFYSSSNKENINNHEINASIFLLEDLIKKNKDYLKKYNNIQQSQGYNSDVDITAEKITIDDFHEKLKEILENLSFFFEDETIIKDPYNTLRDIITTDSIDHYSYFYPMDNSEVGDYSIVCDFDYFSIIDTLIEIMIQIKNDTILIINLTEFYKNNKICMEENKKSKKQDLLEEIFNRILLFNEDENEDNHNFEELYKDITEFIVYYLYLIRIKLECIVTNNEIFKKLLKFDFLKFDEVYLSIEEDINFSEDVQHYSSIINRSIILIEPIYKLVKNLTSVNSTKRNNSGIINGKVQSKMNSFQMLNNLEKIRELKDKYEKLKMEILIEFKKYNREYMLNKKSGVDNETINGKYKETLLKFKTEKIILDNELYDKNGKGFVKEEYKSYISKMSV